MRTCGQTQRFLEHVKTGQLKRNHPGQRRIPCVTATFFLFFQVCVLADVSELVERGEQDGSRKTARRPPCQTAIYRAATATQEWSSTSTHWIMKKLSTGCASVSFSCSLTLALLHAAVSARAPIPWLQPARRDECSLRARITLTLGSLSLILRLKTPLKWHETWWGWQRPVSIRRRAGVVYLFY